ncbi:Hypothetical_protein [Hexamita inflata]|uniref:Hypothetical_protein n=1 Tax=Hexamita inflata TaxID=28002 RepID=A0AA86PA93_9EUKA|nr:Hypothetical protein HINF_LOCUS22686 [Hexamita inflata]
MNSKIQDSIPNLKSQLKEIGEEYQFLESQFNETSEALLATHKLFQQTTDLLGAFSDAVKQQKPALLPQIRDQIKQIQLQLIPVNFSELRPEHDEINAIRAKYQKRLSEISQQLDIPLSGPSNFTELNQILMNNKLPPIQTHMDLVQLGIDAVQAKTENELLVQAGEQLKTALDEQILMQQKQADRIQDLEKQLFEQKQRNEQIKIGVQMQMGELRVIIQQQNDQIRILGEKIVSGM